ncbi:MAG: hypothetical protein VX254_07025 [Planctomycetota bacterium]|nr:hypothetical protein [Planctomycetota bacterium]
MAKKQDDKIPLLVALLVGGTRKNTVRVLMVLGVLLLVGGVALVIALGEPAGIIGFGPACLGFFILVGIFASNFGRWDGYNPAKYGKPGKRKLKDTPENRQLSILSRMAGSLSILLGGGMLVWELAFGNPENPDSYNAFMTGLKWLGAGMGIWFVWFVAAAFNRDWLRGESAGP